MGHSLGFYTEDTNLGLQLRARALGMQELFRSRQSLNIFLRGMKL